MLIIISFTLSFGFALYIYMSRDTGSLREVLDEGDEDTPRAIFENFRLTRYKLAEPVSELSGRIAHLMEPNKVEIYGDVVMKKFTPDGVEKASSETAVAHFKASNVAEIIEKSELVSIDFEKFVEIELKEHILTTSHARYDVEAESVSSGYPVRVDGPGRWFTGSKGFLYQHAKEELDVYGHVRGMVTPDEKK